MAEITVEVNLKGLMAQFDELDKKLKSLPETNPTSPPPILGVFAKGVALAQLAQIYPHIVEFVKAQATSEEWIMKLAALMDIDPSKVEPFIEEAYGVKRPVIGERMAWLIDEKYAGEVIRQGDLFNRIGEFIYRCYLTGSGLPTLEEVKRIWK